MLHSRCRTGTASLGVSNKPAHRHASEEAQLCFGEQSEPLILRLENQTGARGDSLWQSDQIRASGATVSARRSAD